MANQRSSIPKTISAPTITTLQAALIPATTKAPRNSGSIELTALVKVKIGDSELTVANTFRSEATVGRVQEVEQLSHWDSAVYYRAYPLEGVVFMLGPECMVVAIFAGVNINTLK